MSNGTGGRGRQRRAGVLAAAAAGIALLAAACGGGGSSTGASAAGSTPYQKAVAYAQCILSHGQPGWPDPNSQGKLPHYRGKPRGPALSPVCVGEQGCEHLLPNGGQETAAQQQKALSQALKFVACMRSRGIPDFPDPTVQDGQVSQRLDASGFARNSPQLQSARQACRIPVWRRIVSGVVAVLGQDHPGTLISAASRGESHRAARDWLARREGRLRRAGISRRAAASWRP